MLDARNTAKVQVDDDRSASWPMLMATTKAPSPSPLNLLLVEDVQSDAMLTCIGLESAHIPFTLHRMKRGDEAMAVLHACYQDMPSQLPDCILLDLGLPGLDGFEFLEELSQLPSPLRSVPIAVLTAHKHFEHLRKSYPLCIVAYINKPCKHSDLAHLLQRVQKWKEGSETGLCLRHPDA